jgi:predicted MPP superfamily phosphohydrolase
MIRIEKEVIIKSSKYKNNNGIKICHLTDLHLGAIYQRNYVQKVINIIKNIIKPDLVVITGDLFDISYTPMVENIEPFDELNIPILYITGNHEIMIGKNDVLNVLNRTKIKNIGNELSPYIFENINFIGLDFETKIEKLKEMKYDKSMFNVILNHVPISPKDLPPYDIDLFLCGHTHGGQTFPFNVLTLLNAKCYVGLYEFLNRYVYVSSGLGTALIPMRIGSKSVISIINVKSDKEKAS